MKKLIQLFALPLLLTSTNLQAQHKAADGDSAIDIHTNAVCDMCQTTIETEMLYEKGVKAVSVDLTANVIHVEYKANKTNPDKLRTAVVKLGYMADGQLPDAKARAALPDCCQAEGCGLPGEKKIEAVPHDAPVPEQNAPVPADVPTPPAPQD